MSLNDKRSSGYHRNVHLRKKIKSSDRPINGDNLLHLHAVNGITFQTERVFSIPLEFKSKRVENVKIEIYFNLLTGDGIDQ